MRPTLKEQSECGMFCPGWQKRHGMLCLGRQKQHGMLCPGRQKQHGMFCPGWQIFVGCFVRGVKKWHGMFCPGMFCPAPHNDTCKSKIPCSLSLFSSMPCRWVLYILKQSVSCIICKSRLIRKLFDQFRQQ